MANAVNTSTNQATYNPKIMQAQKNTLISIFMSATTSVVFGLATEGTPATKFTIGAVVGLASLAYLLDGVMSDLKAANDA